MNDEHAAPCPMGLGLEDDVDLAIVNHTEHRSKNEEIEALRGFAIIFAVFSHVGSLYFWGDPTYGKITQYVQSWTGVDLFFVISGYVIVRSILREVPKTKTWLSFCSFAVPFWIRRFWRVTPSAWTWIGITVVASFLLNTSGAFGSRLGNISDAIAIFLQVANVHFYLCRIGASAVCAVNEAYWSLSIEEQFYILVPFILFLLPRRVLPLFFAAIALLQVFIFHRSTWSPFGMIRTDGLALGVLIALVEGSPGYDLLEPIFPLRHWAAWMWSSLWLILLIVVPNGVFNVSPFGLGLSVLTGAILVLTASFGCGACFPKGLFRSLMAFIGARSYAIYLIHIPVFLFINEIAVRQNWLDRITDKAALGWLVSLLALILIMLLADLNYRFLETPLRRYGVGVAKRFQERARSAEIQQPPSAPATRDESHGLSVRAVKA
jgi:peptidoglycan/LPS O-acetylase OafA/YrhL